MILCFNCLKKHRIHDLVVVYNSATREVMQMNCPSCGWQDSMLDDFEVCGVSMVDGHPADDEKCLLSRNGRLEVIG
jgi:hypothetical protein